MAQLQLLDNIVAYLPGGARRERCDGPVWKLFPQGMQLSVFRTKLVSPLRNAMSFIDHKVRNGCFAQPGQRVRPRKPLRRKIKQPVLSSFCVVQYRGLLCGSLRTV